MMEFWLISVPLDKISCQSLEKLKRVTAKNHLTTSTRVYIPELKVKERLKSPVATQEHSDLSRFNADQSELCNIIN